MQVTVDHVIDLDEEHAVALAFGLPSEALRAVTRERDEAQDLLRQVAVALGCPDQAPGDLPSSVEAFLAQRDRLRAEVAELRAAIEQVRPVVEALASACDRQGTGSDGEPIDVHDLLLDLGRFGTPFAVDAAWLRSLLSAVPVCEPTGDDRCDPVGSQTPLQRAVALLRSPACAAPDPMHRPGHTDLMVAPEDVPDLVLLPAAQPDEVPYEPNE